MSEKVTNNLLLPPTSTTNSITVTTPQTLQSSGSATGNPRNKCALKPGHSLMDWVRLGNSGVDLAGTRGRSIPVTPEELAKHNTRQDAWLAIRGVVYNVTRYMDFHPGGVDELMRGVGQDATKLFNEVHAWVNYQQLLNKCRIGPLKNSTKLTAVIEESFKTNTITSDPFTKPPLPQPIKDIQPRLDWIQKRNDLSLYFYTKPFCNPGAIIRNLNKEQDQDIEIWILIGIHLHKYNFELYGRVKWPPKDVKIFTESGKIEVNFEKHEEQTELWPNLGKHQVSKLLSNSVEQNWIMDFKLYQRKQFNHDSFIILLKNENALYSLPVGYYLSLELTINGTSKSKCYTPIPLKYLQNIDNISQDLHKLNFLIKQYPQENSFSRLLCQLEEETLTMKVSLPKGNLKLTSLTGHRRICLLAAGSGLTPFLSVIDHLLKRNTNRLELLRLMYFNKTPDDIWCNEILTKLSLTDERFELNNILSNPNESWSGLKGRVNSELIAPVVKKSSIDGCTYIAVCGPTGFNQNVEEILKHLEFPIENVFIF